MRTTLKSTHLYMYNMYIYTYIYIRTILNTIHLHEFLL